MIDPVRSGGRAPGGVRHVVVGEDHAGVRLDRFLGQQYPGVPRSRLFRIVRKGEVRVNGRRAGPEQRLANGDDVRLPPVRPEAEMGPLAGEVTAGDAAAGVARAGLAAARGATARGAVAGGVAARGTARDTAAVGSPRARRIPASLVEQIAAAVIHEDERLLVINKPAGVAVHGGSGISFGVIEALRAARPDEREQLELVHRLDRDTSGVLLVARRPAVLRMLHAGLREGEGFEKRYLALLKGSWQLGKKRIDAPLRTDLRVGGERTVRVQAGGKVAASDFRPVQFFGRTATLVEVSILTGRTPQIRVHAAFAGHPVAGDEKYGDEEFNAQLQQLGLRRMFLHAASISFTWPDRGTEFSANAPLPADLAAVIDTLAAAAGRRGRGRR
ncbi:MAG: RluA family pseudouridine synthase [Steroidobacteraceae bacterium]